MKQIRRVITGETADGRSRIISTDHIQPMSIAGVDVFPLWGLQSLPAKLPATGLEDPANARGFGLISTTVGVLPPNGLVRGNDNAADLEFDSDGFHKTDTVDIAYVVSGSVILRVPGEPDTHLSAGDCVVQHGALHAWCNESDDDAVLVWILAKGDRAGTGEH